MTDPDDSITTLIPPEPATTTSYVVLEEVTSTTANPQAEELYRVHSTVPARDSNHALQTVGAAIFSDRPDGTEATLVAVPERSWRPKQLTARVETIVKLEGL